MIEDIWNFLNSIPNGITLFVEIGVGIGIGIIFHRKTKAYKNQSDELMQKIKKQEDYQETWIKNEEKRRKERRNNALIEMFDHLTMSALHLKSAIDEFDKQYDENTKKMNMSLHLTQFIQSIDSFLSTYDLNFDYLELSLTFQQTSMVDFIQLSNQLKIRINNFSNTNDVKQLKGCNAVMTITQQMLLAHINKFSELTEIIKDKYPQAFKK